MKNTFKEQKPNSGAPKNSPVPAGQQKQAEIKTDSPLSEKDEVKRAEERMRSKGNRML